MIYTVSLNPAVDKTVVIPAFEAGRVNRIASAREDVGGKGINVARCLAGLGESVCAVALLAGQTGERCLSFLREAGIEPLTLAISGQTRTNLKIVDPVTGQNTDVNEPGPQVTPAETDILRQRLCQRLCRDDVVVLTGSLPRGAAADTYESWARACMEKGAHVLLDADGDALSAGLRAAPRVCKPNGDELARLIGCRPTDIPGWVQAGRGLQAMGVHTAVISLGGEGALFLFGPRAYFAPALQVEVRSTVGAGDAMVAALAYGLARGLDEEQTVRLAVAMGAAAVTLEGTGLPPAALVERLRGQVQVRCLGQTSCKG